MALNEVSGSFASDTQSAAFDPKGSPFAVSLTGSGWVASVTIEFSIDGTNWIDLPKNNDGDAATFTAPGRYIVDEVEMGVTYRLDCDWTSGTVTYKLSQ